MGLKPGPCGEKKQRNTSASSAAKAACCAERAHVTGGPTGSGQFGGGVALGFWGLQRVAGPRKSDGGWALCHLALQRQLLLFSPKSCTSHRPPGKRDQIPLQHLRLACAKFDCCGNSSLGSRGNQKVNHKFWVSTSYILS